MEGIIVTNNICVYEKYKDLIKIKYEEGFTYLDVLRYVRDQVHKGYRLITHPLAGSVKPNETPYRSIIISDDKDSTDFDSLMIIEESIATANKFIKNKATPAWSEKILDDFRIIDLSLVENAMQLRS